MILTLELPCEVEAELAEDARRRGISLEQHVLSLLAERCPSIRLPRNGAELVADWRREEVIGSRPDILDSEVHARALREEAERRGRPGLQDPLLAGAPRADLPASSLRGRRR